LVVSFMMSVWFGQIHLDDGPASLIPTFREDFSSDAATDSESFLNRELTRIKAADVPNHWPTEHAEDTELGPIRWTTTHTKMIAASRAQRALHAVIGLRLEPKRIRPTKNILLRSLRCLL
jgi:hypothetical protein